MRILLVTSTFPRGPGESFLAPEIRALSSLGHEVSVVPIRSPGGPSSARPLGGARAERLFGSRVVLGGAAELTRGLRLPGFAPLLHGRVFARNVAALPKALWIAQIARDWGADHVHAYWGSVPATAAWIASERTGIPWSFTLHRWDIYEDNLLGQKLLAASFARVVSERGRDDVRRLAPASPPPRVLHLGVDLPSTDANPPWGGTELRVLMPASFVPIKGHEVLFRAMSHVDGVRVDLAGDGPLRRDLRDTVGRLCLDGRVRFLGSLPHGELLARLNAGSYDAVVLPSLEISDSEHEGIPVALMEGMARALPVVSTLSGSIPELVDESCGLLVPAGDPIALAGSLESLARDPELRRELGRAGRARIAKSFDAYQLARTLCGWFEEST